MNRTTLALVLPLTLALLPLPAEAQFRPIYPGYPGYRYAEPESDLRITVRPSDASVYVDGYFAGKVTEFDGAFQRLHVTPGQHDIVIFLEGYRSLRQQLYLSPRQTRTIAGQLERLSAGEAQEPAPVPTERPEPLDPNRVGPPRGPAPRPAPGDPRDADSANGDPAGTQSDAAARQGSRSGALSIRVQPSGSTVLVDGERWSGPSENERLIIQVSEGHHTIEVRSDGFDPFLTEIDVRRGQTTPVNISLTRAR